MRVAIFGKYKTGTTALFYKLKDALRPDQELFEPAECPRILGDRVLAKVILDPEQVDCDGFLHFEKRIYLVRDPRDWMVSGAIFLAQESPHVFTCERVANRFLELLQRKECDPRAVTLAELLALVCVQPPTVCWLSQYHAWLSVFEARVDGYRFFYEDLVQGRFEALSHYLERPISSLAPEVETSRAHVLRSGGTGDWRHWWTLSDIEQYRPGLEDFLGRHGYAESWELAPQPHIAPQHASEYARRVINRRCRQFDLAPLAD